ncbi:MAG: class I SAM-dependent methyltransferase [Mediterranea sp.]|jgi:SAM-dependent methyltransferase|nr:class I SAM-dependent methyltransferase [Mediterranea sp.]
MQKRHSDRRQYFIEQAATSEEFYMNYINGRLPIERGFRVLEIGCGEGGNLLPFARAGCSVSGIDRSAVRISQARDFFRDQNCSARFFDGDFFEMECRGEADKYHIILVHDVIEHIRKKDAFITHIRQFLRPGGIIFWAFPAWQMPFGGHQQICKSRCSGLPFIHLLPERLYRSVLKFNGEDRRCIEELTEIKKCGVSIEQFEKLLQSHSLLIIDRRLWFINPHYKQKFNLKPRRLYPFVAGMKYVRNFFTTSCFYITKYAQEAPSCN